MSPWRPDRPFNDLGTIPVDDLETRDVLRRCIGARAELAELKQATELIPNPRMLINTVPLLEAQASSEIENVVTTSDALFRSLHASGAVDAGTREALRYREALLAGHRILSERPLGTGTAEMVCGRILGRDMRVRRVPGTALRNTGTGEVVYTPPDGEARLRSLLADWERFLHDSHEIDPLIRMAAAHYQFEAIHPFTDGNGRTGRVLNTLFLVEQELLSIPILYLSRYILAGRADYYRLLHGVTKDGAWEPWLLFMLDGVRETAAWTTAKIAAIRKLSTETAGYVRRRRPKIYSSELVDVLFEQPYCRIGNIVEAGIVARQAASRYLKALAEIGVLSEQTVGREKLFVNMRLLTILTEDTNEFRPF